MSNLPGNYFMQKLVDEKMPQSSESLATLALAYEQRTANLIALMEAPDDIAIPGIDYAEAARQIGPRLGLGENNA